MCGIFGVIGSKTPSADVLEGLTRLEYRGYDSAGIACVEDNALAVRRSVGKLSSLRDTLYQKPLSDKNGIAIGHTRWATHGAPNEANAHPHANDTCAVVHNGIIENYLDLRTQLGKSGYNFQSETDTEVLPALIRQHMKAGKGELGAVIETMKSVNGAFALGITFADNKNSIIAARRGSPLLVGLGDNVSYIGSDAIALAPFTNRVVYLENDDVAVLTTKGVTVYNLEGRQVERPVKVVDVSSAMAGKNGYRHFMLKEIHEQPTVIGQTLNAYTSSDHSEILLPEMPFDLAAIPQITLVACGTSYHAGLVAKYWFEQLAGVPVNIDVASEFRYRQPPLVKGGLGIFISQSGETADTLAALEYSKENHQHVVGLVNVPTSSIARMSDVILSTKAGPEIGVASTKAFTTQLTVLALLALKTAQAKGRMNNDAVREHLQALAELPSRLTTLLDREGEIEAMADEFVAATSSLFLARGQLCPIALEGALKLKEISYIHAEGYAAGEMKHGPIALIDEQVPVVVIAPWNNLFEKTLSNLREVEARKGRIYLFTDRHGAHEAQQVSGNMFISPDAHPFVQPILQTVPLQLLAYHVAVKKGTDVDQPRNLAKSVTVE